MKKTIIKTAFLGILAAGLTTSCSKDLDIHSIDPQSVPTSDDMSLLVKAYSTLGLTGQKGAAGNGDISSDEGESGFYRTTFNLEVLPTDECNWAWQTDTDIPQITGISWSASSQRTMWCYQRLGFDISLFNFYLQTTASKTDDDYKYYRAEVRFLRALNYWYFLDLWHKAPFKDETNDINDLPVEKAGKDLYDWLDNELTSLTAELAPIGEFNNADNFGRVDKGAALLLHARLCLNAEVYTDGAVKAYDKAITYCDELIKSGKYSLCQATKNGYSGYAQLFMADNDENTNAMNEIILPIRQDGLQTRCYSGANYLVSSTRITGMPYAGTTNCWSCNYARPNLIEKFFPNDDIPMATDDGFSSSAEAEVIAHDTLKHVSTADVLAKAGDDRALFYAGFGGGIRKLRTDKLSNFLDGVSVVKFQNIRTDGKATHDVEFPDMDIPLMRFAEAYLTRAEAKWRTGDDGLADINYVRSRAGAAKLNSLSEQDIIDEWSREFYMEGRRRSDLIRFNMFTGKNYIWAWKGGIAAGQTVDSHYKFYPIPTDDLNNNPNMTQNTGY